MFIIRHERAYSELDTGVYVKLQKGLGHYYLNQRSDGKNQSALIRHKS